VKVLFLTPKKDAPSTKWRVMQFIPHFEKAGVTCAVEEWPAGMFARLALAKKGIDFDVVVLQKRLLPKLLANRLRKHAKALVFEFDDLLMLKKDEQGSVKESPTKERRFKRSVRMADAVITTNDTLAELARRAAAEPDRVHVMPTVIDLARWSAREPGGEAGKAIVGWMGTPTNLHSMSILQAPLSRLCRRFDGVNVRVVCDDPLALEGVRLEHRKFSAIDEVRDVREFDVAVAPLVEDPWTRGKVSTKVLAYFAAGVPVVASDVGANRLYVREGENGFLVGTVAQWEERLAKLVEDPALRAKMGAAARASVERDYSIEAMVPRYLSLFERLAKQPRQA